MTDKTTKTSKKRNKKPKKAARNKAGNKAGAKTEAKAVGTDTGSGDVKTKERPEELPSVGFSGNPTADFGSRLAAFCADSAILFIAVWSGLWVLTRLFRAVGGYKLEPCDPGAVVMCSQAPGALSWFSAIVALASLFVYSAYFDGTRGATIGKHLLSLQVRDKSEIQTEGFKPIGFSRAALRSLVKYLPLLITLSQVAPLPFNALLPGAMTPFLFIAALLTLASGVFNKHGISLHDHASSTVVVDRRLAGLPRGSRFVEQI